MHSLPLRVIRKLLRRLDAALDPAQKSNLKDAVPTTNGCEAELDSFLSLIEFADPNAAAYLQGHKQRLIRTLSILPLGTAQSRALELGSYLQMAAALHRVLGYGFVQPAYYSPSIGKDRKSLAIKGQQPFTTEVDLFDAESHTYPYPDSAFDLVLCCELIEHLLHDPMHMLLECWRVLADGGALVLTTPNISSLSSVAAALQGKQNPQVFSRYPAPGNADLPHVREYTPHELTESLRAAGFEIESLFTERLPRAHHATWVSDILDPNGFDASFRGEQMYCVARKRGRSSVDRFPQFLYSR